MRTFKFETDYNQKMNPNFPYIIIIIIVMIEQKNNQRVEILCKQSLLFYQCINNEKKKMDIDVRLMFEGNLQNFDDKYVAKIVNDACQTFIGKFGVARLDIDVGKIDQFSGLATISLTQVSVELLLKFWSAICFCNRVGKITIVDYSIKPQTDK